MTICVLVQEVTLADSVTSDSVVLGRYPNGAYTTPLTAVWLRTRAYPPSGVMPSVTFGAVQLVYPILSISVIDIYRDIGGKALRS